MGRSAGWLTVAMAFGVAGCSSIPPAPKVIYVPVEHRVPKIKLPARPMLPIESLAPRERNAAKIMKAYAGSVCALIGYTDSLIRTFAPYESTRVLPRPVSTHPCGHSPPH